MVRFKKTSSTPNASYKILQNRDVILTHAVKASRKVMSAALTVLEEEPTEMNTPASSLLGEISINTLATQAVHFHKVSQRLMKY